MRILYVTTTFPVYSETFLQREVRALCKSGVEIEILSLHKGVPNFEGQSVQCFSKWSLLKLLYLLPWLIVCGRSVSQIVKEMNVRRPASWLNLFENLLGFGAAIVLEKRVRCLSPDIVHCVWASAPAAFGMFTEALTGIRFSTGAHAYDIFEYGGDWLLEMKLQRAALVHVSTASAARRIEGLCESEKVKLIRRGLSSLPDLRSPRSDCFELRIVCVARLVEKKGVPLQLEIYRCMRASGLAFEARIIGDGPMEEEILGLISKLGLADCVSLRGRLSEREVLAELAWADLLFHTGIVASSGDRDGLPNVVPEAMASGAVVIGSPVSGVLEAIEDGSTGFICAPWSPGEWVERCLEFRDDLQLRNRLSSNAREWVEREFVADRNTGYLLECLEVARG